MLNQQGRILSVGFNTRGQLGLGTNQSSNAIY
ncbi:MAG: hypothetical protein EBR10_11255, partial [Planctomycetes bacterium]|nr:hypothetical protein [Planctomycetota bacterium]